MFEKLRYCFLGYQSSVLDCILDEMVVVEGDRVVKGAIAYAAQEAWILGGTLRDNILFGKPYPMYDEEYQQVVAACCLTRVSSFF